MRSAEVIAGERAEHEDVAVREIDEPQHAIHHRVAERDQRVDRAQRKAVDDLLAEITEAHAEYLLTTPSNRAGD